MNLLDLLIVWPFVCLLLLFYDDGYVVCGLVVEGMGLDISLGKVLQAVCCGCGPSQRDADGGEVVEGGSYLLSLGNSLAAMCFFFLCFCLQFGEGRL